MDSISIRDLWRERRELELELWMAEWWRGLCGSIELADMLLASNSKGENLRSCMMIN